MKKIIPLLLVLLLACHPIRQTAIDLDTNFKMTSITEDKISAWIADKSSACLDKAKIIKIVSPEKALPTYLECVKHPFEVGAKSAELIEDIRRDIKVSASQVLEVASGKKRPSSLGNVTQYSKDKLSQLSLILEEIK